MVFALPVLGKPAGSTRVVDRVVDAPIGDDAERGPAGVMSDSHGRVIRDLRLSITDRCNFRCVYCMEPDARFLPADELLSVDELVRVSRVCIGLGVRKIRLTGGEPTVRKDLESIIAGVAALEPGDLAMTTNGRVADMARLREWKRLGLRRVTISLDTLRDDRFGAMTRSRMTPGDVLAAVRGAAEAGLGPVRVNAVVVRGYNEDEVADLAALARSLGIEMRFIEFMPLDAGRGWGPERVVPADEIVSLIAARFPLITLGRENRNSTSELYGFADGAQGRIGVIAPVSRPFCGACSRLRVTAEGRVRACLFSREEWDLRDVMRRGGGDADVERVLRAATWRKQAGHGIGTGGFVQPDRAMSAIGG